MRGFIAIALMLAAAPVAADELDVGAEIGADLGQGTASYFSREIAGNRTASGERCDPDTLTAAHRTAPFGSKVRVTNLSTGQSVIVRINDRGPFRAGRVIDLSHAAAREIGMHRTGTAKVSLALLDD
ncbi:septal ring lytic transglycosylase RlpA family protein [Sphingomonas sp. MG17]|uniref:Endolytic peptidoglycan transglycosylase RlpA n=1 Tax=Sphingomonas tagetis TaxID=2949092 RepID=A0A9X2HLW6_9SPHN|nr:septal ring lytic transglycosylase RlpA family protein [Sphingomonas tagetis]MCP3729708.1 septal ring lytic transglycosylase RlpA family protein [Sphingomonas tagetis]